MPHMIGAANIGIGTSFQGFARAVLAEGKGSCSARPVRDSGTNAGLVLPVVKAGGQKDR